MARVFKRIFDVVFILVIMVLVGYFILRSTNRIMIYRVKTGSMEDNIHVGDYILIVRKDDYNVGDVVTFEKYDGFITHRIIKIDGDTITTKGDANNVEDDTIDKKTIVGKVIISGGIVNIIINYKYALVGGLLSLYLFSCYFSSRKKEEDNFDILSDEKDDDIIKLEDNKENEELQNNCSETIDEIKEKNGIQENNNDKKETKKVLLTLEEEKLLDEMENTNNTINDNKESDEDIKSDNNINTVESQIIKEEINENIKNDTTNAKKTKKVLLTLEEEKLLEEATNKNDVINNDNMINQTEILDVRVETETKEKKDKKEKTNNNIKKTKKGKNLEEIKDKKIKKK